MIQETDRLSCLIFYEHGGTLQHQMRPPTALASAGLLQPGNLALPPAPGSLGTATPQRLPLQCLAWARERAAAFRQMLFPT